MQDIMKTKLLKIAVNPDKKRTYCVMQGFWKKDEEREKQLPDLFQQLSQQVPQKGTLVLDTSELRIMHPRVAELFLPAFTKCLLEKEIKALAHVGRPENIVLKLQFERVLSDVKGADTVRHKSFIEAEEAELWLDRQY